MMLLLCCLESTLVIYFCLVIHNFFRVSLVKRVEHGEGNASLDFKEKVVCMTFFHGLIICKVHACGPYKLHHWNCGGRGASDGATRLVLA